MLDSRRCEEVYGADSQMADELRLETKPRKEHAIADSRLPFAESQDSRSRMWRLTEFELVDGRC